MKIKRIIPFLALLLLILSIGASAASKQTEFDKEAGEAEIIELFQPYFDTLNNMEDEIIASLEADEECMARLNKYSIDKEKFASAFAGQISIKMLATSAIKNFGKISCSLTYPDADLMEDSLDAFVEKYFEQNELVYSSDEELNQWVGNMLIAFIENPDFPVKKTVLEGNYFNGGDGWEFKNEDDIKGIIESLCYLADNFL